MKRLAQQAGVVLAVAGTLLAVNSSVRSQPASWSWSEPALQSSDLALVATQEDGALRHDEGVQGGELVGLEDAAPESEQEPKAFGLGPDAARLAQLLTRYRDGAALKVAATGGSITAGGGSIPSDERYFSKFARLLPDIVSSAGGKKGSTKPGRISIVEAGHGGENSLFGALMFPTLVPEDTDLLLWEYATNDKTAPRTKCCTQDDMLFAQSLFLRRVAAMKKPPVVILVYTWSVPTDRVLRKQLPLRDASLKSTFAHVLQHPLVAGYVSFTTWVQGTSDPPPAASEVKARFFADNVHANRQGHLVMGKLLGKLSSAALSNAESGGGELFSASARFPLPRWPCGTEGSLVRDALTQLQTTYAWTVETPRVESQGLPLDVWDAEARSTISLEAAGLDTVMYGRGDPVRLDRKLELRLPKCADRVFLRFDLRGVRQHTSVFYVHADAVRDLRISGGSGASADLLEPLEIVNATHWSPQLVPVPGAAAAAATDGHSQGCLLQTFPREEFQTWAPAMQVVLVALV
ncbi:Hypothetical Protein FCC1311_061722 [Hondaea fermentalgiana]|uniref:SGNH hydrolase-type esterase domain-containing protein n=1 Tax=Hondaea fermentalgiana TaxID=2315210 RepID=A0A2R5GGB8_9STRA|nr:Hypothetical Protein FCC1311_061722 [Hondaea fermentalgiana]|eukprot:GBG29952.1 Hypothetical Protein FCC1311_061722 [Hondaea fermentalgiana]